MNTLLTIDGQEVAIQPGRTVLEAARQIGIDIPTLCHLKECGPLTTCLVCLVKINGKLLPSCATQAAPGMVVESETEEVHEARRTALELLFSDHVGDCLSPCQRLCPLQLNIPEMIRQIESGALEEAVATVRQALPLPAVLGRLCHHPCEQGCRRGAADDSADIRGLERFIADHDLRLPSPHLTPCRAATGKSAAIVGAGPAGLGAAYHLTLQGHSVTVFDRHARAGGSLRAVAEAELPREVLTAEVVQLERLGVEIISNVELGVRVSLDDLRRDYDAVLLAVGERGASEGEKLAVTVSASGIKTDAATAQTSVPGVFATGAAVKPVKQLVRAMTEGRGAAECVHRFLMGEPVRRSGKPFSSVMGKLDAPELKLFLQSASSEKRHVPCDTCAGFSAAEAKGEAARCLHCDCRSAGACAFQHYAQVYEADASRFRAARAPFEQQLQPGGVIYEPGKCILCGICVKLTEQAGEPLGLTFIGRGFNVRIAAPFDHTIEAGLQKIAAECVKACPTGALAMR
ncbi:MAG: FAD-dependent oxidoreductase [Verrucomicrobiota bacterium]